MFASNQRYKLLIFLLLIAASLHQTRENLGIYADTVEAEKRVEKFASDLLTSALTINKINSTLNRKKDERGKL